MDFSTALFRRPTNCLSTHQLSPVPAEASFEFIYVSNVIFTETVTEFEFKKHGNMHSFIPRKEMKKESSGLTFIEQKCSNQSR